MNEKKARKIRKKVYGDKDFRDRSYYTKEVIGKDGRKRGIITTVERGQKISTRRVYQIVKKENS